MKILLNLATLKKGGGQNVGLNMVKCLISEKYDLSKFSFVVAKGSPIEMELKNNEVKEIISVPKNPLKRMILELTKGRKIIKQYHIDVVYTLFGIGLYQKAVNKSRAPQIPTFFFPR